MELLLIYTHYSKLIICILLNNIVVASCVDSKTVDTYSDNKIIKTLNSV